MASDKTPDDLFLDTLKDLSYAGKQIAKSLFEMAKPAQPHDLRAGFEQDLDETEVHVDRLGQVFGLIGKPARAKTCDSILGIIEEGKSVIDELKGTEALDPGLLSAAKAVEHCEIAHYGTLNTWADQLGYKEGVCSTPHWSKKRRRTGSSARLQFRKSI